MKKFCWILLNICTLGIAYLIAKKKAKKLATVTNHEFKVTSKIDFDIEQLILTLGGINNIVDLSATISTLKINLKDASTLTKEQFLPFQNHGFMKNHNQVILVLGDNSQTVGQLIQDKLNNRLVVA